MINFKDRLPNKPNRKKITKEDGSSEFVTIEYADEPSTEGTPLNRASFMAIQGYENFTMNIDFDNMKISTISDNGTSTSNILFNSDDTIDIISSFTDLYDDVTTKTIHVDNTIITGVIL